MNKEERRKMIHKAWEKLKPWERFMTTSLVLVGVLMSMTGVAMMIRGCQAM